MNSWNKYLATSDSRISFQFRNNFLYFLSKVVQRSKNIPEYNARLISCFLRGEPVLLILTKISLEATLFPKISEMSSSYSIIGMGYLQNFDIIFSYTLLTFFDRNSSKDSMSSL